MITENDLIVFPFTNDKIQSDYAYIVEICDLPHIISLDKSIVDMLKVGYQLVFIEDELSTYLIKDNHVVNLKRGNYKNDNVSINYLYIPTQWRLVNGSIIKSYQVEQLPVLT